MGPRSPPKNGQFWGIVCLIEKHWETLQRFTQKRLNRSRCRLGTDLCGPEEALLDWIKVGRIHSPREGWQDGDAAFRQNSLTTCSLLIYFIHFCDDKQISKIIGVAPGNVAHGHVSPGQPRQNDCDNVMMFSKLESSQRARTKPPRRRHPANVNTTHWC